jgi:hypothetical protein
VRAKGLRVLPEQHRDRIFAKTAKVHYPEFADCDWERVA